MTEVNTVKCNECGTLKLATNHWLVSIMKPRLKSITFQPEESVKSPRNPNFEYENHCGDRCALIRFSRYLDELKASRNPTA